MTPADLLRIVFAHWDDILAGVTLAMTALVGIAHGCAWLAGIFVRLSLLTATKDDDKAAAAFLAWALRMQGGADWLARQHARLMPQTTPGLERAEGGRDA